jgi:hypothetical protein
LNSLIKKINIGVAKLTASGERIKADKDEFFTRVKHLGKL